ncbi:MAG: type transport system permease protein [Pseudonocardiales bacterium]|nr:type transport system permease protein [Pseudonocardiales bacterium]
MIRIIRAELIRVLRRRTIAIMAASALAFAAVAALTVFSTARKTGTATRRSGATRADLVGDGGGTQAFAVGASFVGFWVFVIFIALIATEFSGGTFRAVLLREPHRLRVIVGKLAGLLLVAAALVALVEVLTLGMSLLLAPTKDIATDQWFSLDSVGAALRDYVTVFGGIAGWAVFGTTLAVIFRSAPLALGVGFAWAGPFENITVDNWSAGYRFYPGQVLGSLIRGGTAELGIGRAVITALVYTGIAAAATLVLVSRRDVTA